MDKFDADKAGSLNCIGNVRILRKESIGEQPVVGLKTTTGTFIAEGFASHNSGQRPSCEWAVGIAQGRGCKVYLPPESDLLKCNFLYGYEQDAALAFDRKLAAREGEMNTHVTNLDTEIARLTEIRAQYRGALQDTQHLRQNWRSLHTT